MAVAELVDADADLLLRAVAAVRDRPAPLGGVPARLSALAHASQELRGVYLRELAAADTTGEPAAAGCRGAADLLVQSAGLPAWQARADWSLAARLAGVPGLLDALAEGAVELPAARVLARAWGALPVRLRDHATAGALVRLAQLVDLRDLRAKVDELVAALAPDVTDADLADARESAELVLTGVGAQTRVSGHLDALTGEWLRDVLTAKAEHDRGLGDPRSTGTRLLDALLDLVRSALAGGAGPAGDTATLVVIADVDDVARCADPSAARAVPEDAVADLFAGAGLHPAGGGGTDRGPDAGSGRWTARTRGGVPVGPLTLAQLCCGAVLTRVVVDPLGHPLDSSPRARQLSRRERRALEHRAGYRCERSGCGRPAAVCVPHHVVPWALGGPSTQANTVLLCPGCHALLHDRRRALALTRGRRIGPRGWLSSGPAPP